MKHQILILVAILTLGISWTAFPQAKPPAASVATVEEPPPVLSVPKDYKYDARGRRDPFVNPVPKPKVQASAGPPSARPPGLKGVLVGQATITGVVTSKEPAMNIVIISGPGAKAPYFARVGDALYDAVVKSIKIDTVTFALTMPTVNPNVREIVRKVRPSGEDK